MDLQKILYYFGRRSRRKVVCKAVIHGPILDWLPRIVHAIGTTRLLFLHEIVEGSSGIVAQFDSCVTYFCLLKSLFAFLGIALGQAADVMQVICCTR